MHIMQQKPRISFKKKSLSWRGSQLQNRPTKCPPPTFPRPETQTANGAIRFDRQSHHFHPWSKRRLSSHTGRSGVQEDMSLHSAGTGWSKRKEHHRCKHHRRKHTASSLEDPGNMLHINGTTIVWNHHLSSSSHTRHMDWFKGKFTENPHI
jgi:hypothetical protein